MNSLQAPKILFTVPTLAKALKLDPSYIRRMIYAKTLCGRKMGGAWIIEFDPLNVPDNLKDRWETYVDTIPIPENI